MACALYVQICVPSRRTASIKWFYVDAGILLSLQSKSKRVWKTLLQSYTAQMTSAMSTTTSPQTSRRGMSGCRCALWASAAAMCTSIRRRVSPAQNDKLSHEPVNQACPDPLLLWDCCYPTGTCTAAAVSAMGAEG